MLDFVTFGDVMKCALQSVLLHIKVIREYGYNMYFLSYKAFEWCMADYAIRHIPEDAELVFSFICDRYSVMIDKSPHKNKSLIQHGTMHFKNKSLEIPYLVFEEDKGFYIWTSLYKCSPSKVYCYTETDEWALSNSVIANNPQYIHIGYGFKPSFAPSKKSVLIVSNFYIFAPKEEQILIQLQDLDVEIYLKNHPSHADSLYDDMRSKYNFTFIAGYSTSYPAVDILISYDSTLACEYASIGTKVLYYGHFDIANVRNVVKGILEVDHDFRS